MDSTPSPSSSSPFDLVSSALGRYIPRGGAAAAGPAESRDDSGGHRPEHDRPPVGRQEQILGAVNLDRELRVTHRNLEAPVFAGLDAAVGSPFVDLLPPGDVPTVTRRLRQVLDTGEAHVARVQRLRRGDGSELVVSMSILPRPRPGGPDRLRDRDGQEAAPVRRRDGDRHLAGHRRNGAVPGGVPAGLGRRGSRRPRLRRVDGRGVTERAQGRIRLRRAALVPDRAWPEGYVTLGEDLPSDASRLLSQAIRRADAPQSIVIPDREAIERVLGSPRLVRALVPGDRSAGVACVPLVLEGDPPVVLGVAEVWRRADRPFADSELFDLQELVARTSHHVDLARQHQREHTQVLALQRRLLPRSAGGTVQTASVYQPATPDSAGVGETG